MKFKLILAFMVLVVGVGVCGYFYSYVFARTVVGEIVDVKHAGATGFAVNREIAFSMAVAVKDGTSGEIVTASTEDRQWAVAKAGMCAEAKFFPYPPWDLEKSGTYYNARLVKLSECPAK